MTTAKRKADNIGDSHSHRDSAKLRKIDVSNQVDISYATQRRIHLENLPDELLLRIIHFLCMEDVITCQRVSQRISSFTKDPQIWKQLYYARFVYHRLLGGVRTGTLRQKPPGTWFSMFDKIAGKDWKSRFRLHYKWSKGRCTSKEIVLASEALPETFLSLRANKIITADTVFGLRAWDMSSQNHTLIATGTLGLGDDHHDLQPSALSVELNYVLLGKLMIAVGYQSGEIGIYTFDLSSQSFTSRQIFSCFDHEAVLSLSQAGPGYLLAMSPTHALSLFQIDRQHEDKKPILVYSLKSQSDWTPVSVSLRASPTLLVASITYVFPRFVSGWSVGLQELRWNVRTRKMLSTRVATAPHQGDTIPSARLRMAFKGPYLPPTSTKPTSLCYTHPYLLATHPDNTLSLYMVRSTDSELLLSPGKRLWGHTSDIHAANIGDRGKAVTVARGGDVRVWELEEGLTSAAARKATPGPMVSVKLQPVVYDENPSRNVGPRSTKDFESSEFRIKESIPASIDFDDERLIVLSNKGPNAQALSIYDFT